MKHGPVRSTPLPCRHLQPCGSLLRTPKRVRRQQARAARWAWARVLGTGWVVVQGAVLPGHAATLPPAATAEAPWAALPPGLLDQGLELMRQAAQALAPARARVVVTVGAPDGRLKLAPCSSGTVQLVAGAPAWGSTRMAVRCTQGAPWNIQVPVRVQAFAPALVAASALSTGTTLASPQLAQAEVDWAAHGTPPAATPALRPAARASLYGPTQAQHLLGRMLARPLADGAPVSTADLQSRQWFAAGAVVSVIAQGDGFLVLAEGVALSAGLEGQPVRVRTENGRVLTGQATGERRVELRL